MKNLIIKYLPLIDLVLVPFTYIAGWLLKNIRRIGVHRMPHCKKALLNVGVFPIRDHYYEPQFNYELSNKDMSKDRYLPGIDWNIEKQLQMLESFKFAEEIRDLPQEKSHELQFYMNNGAFGSGDAEYWYQIIRALKPKRIFEIGCGNSTLIAIQAIQKIQDKDKNFKCQHVCIEPYEMPWLEKTNVSIIRKKVEEVQVSFFSQLEEGDILFIDSSHIIRPQGDVLFEYLEILPSLNKGVVVHIHDIFSPKNYPKQWVQDWVRLWNEQYLLEAFLTNNRGWEIIGAINFLHHKHYDKLSAIAPFLKPEREPGSFYIQKIV